MRRLDLRTIENDDTRVDAFVAVLEGGADDRPTADDQASLTDGFIASGKMNGKRTMRVAAGWVPQFTASGKAPGKVARLTA